MKSVLVLGALAGLSSGALAQSLSVHVSFADLDLAIGETTTATMAASFTTVTDHLDSYFAAAVFTLQATASSSGFAASDLAFADWHHPGVGPLTGEVDGAGIRDIYIGQHHLVADVDTTSSDFLIATWTVTRLDTGSLSYEAVESSRNEPFPFAIVDTGLGEFGEVFAFEYDVVTSDTIPAIPVPASGLVLGLGGILAARRRR